MPGNRQRMRLAVRAGLVPSVLLALSLGPVSALEIQFSPAEGYPANSSPLNGTPAGKPVWLTSPEAFSVDGTRKAVEANVKDDSATALLVTPIPLAAGQTVAISADFQFAGLNKNAAGAEGGIHGPNIGLGASSTELFQNVFGILFGHFAWAEDDYTLQVNPGGKAVHFSAVELGLDGRKELSDRLRFTLEITKGDNSSDWRYQVVLFNVTRDVEVGSFSGSDITTPQEFYDSPNVYLNLNRGSSEETGGPAAVTFFSIKSE